MPCPEHDQEDWGEEISEAELEDIFGVEADDWLARAEKTPHVYAAIYDATDPTWPAPISESLGDHAEAHVSGLLPMFLAGGAGFAAGAYFWPALRAKIDEWRAHRAMV